MIKFKNPQEALQAFAQDKAMHEERGVTFPEAVSYIPEQFRGRLDLAMDAQPGLSTEANSAVPAMLTTYIDPQVYEILFSPNKAAEILGERRNGDWLMETAMFPVVEHTGEVSSYGDFNENGRAGANTNWPNRQSYSYQTMKEYGQRELERAGLARINWVAEIDRAAATVMKKYENFTYFFGVQGLQNYGLLNDPNLSGALSPAPKAAGGTAWVQNGVIVATPNEIYTDIQSILLQLISQTNGLVNEESKLVLALSPQSKFALTATNSFNVNVRTLLKENLPNIRIVDAVQYGALSSTNPQGVVAGNFVQLIAEETEGQQTGYCAFTEKMRAFKIIPGTSSFKQKVMGGSWGTIWRMPVNVASMVGV